MGSPMVIHLYGKDGEAENTFNQSFVPWKMLKKAVKLSESMNKENPTEEDIDAISGLVVSVFGDRFSVEDLDEKADVGEMMAVLEQIVATAKAIKLNPTPPGK